MENLVQVDRKTPFLMPQDLKDWLPENHIVHFIIEAVEAISPNVNFHLNKRGSGSKQFSPEMMMELLIYSYSTKRFSSYAIEKATYTDIPMMYITAMNHPDHNTINNFRKNNQEAFKQVFTQVLLLAQNTGLMKKLGTISVDGTKIHANASKHKTVSYKYAKEQIAKYEKEVEELLKEAEKIDNTEVEQIFEKLPERLPQEKSGEGMTTEKMLARLKTEEGQRIYSKRKTTVEPVFGIIKRVMGFRQFLMRGLENIGIEWDLVTISYNISQMFTLKNLSLSRI